MSQGVRKLYIDSRFRLSGGTASSFDIDVGDTIDLPHNAIAYVTECTMVSSWLTLDEQNRHLYFMTRVDPGSGLIGHCVKLPSAQYDLESLRLVMETALNNTNVTGFAANWAVERVSSLDGVMPESIGSALRYLKVSNSGDGEFMLPGDAWLEEHFGSSLPTFYQYDGTTIAQNFDPTAIASCSDVLAFPNEELASSHTSSFVDLRGKRTLFIHSPSFGNYSTLAPRGVRAVLCKMPVYVGYGQVMSYAHSGGSHDFVDVGVQSLRVMHFELRDARGNLVDLQGSEWGATLIFARKQ